MRFYKKMYISARIDDRRRIRHDLEKGKAGLLTYVLVLGEDPEGKPVLEIMHWLNLEQDYYRTRSPLVVGAAVGKQDAINLVRDITQEAVDRTGRWDVAAYLHDIIYI